MKKNFYLTTPIFYPNSLLHLGHAYTITVADVIARFKEIDGYAVSLQTGSDEHGEKILKEASLKNLAPIELVNLNVGKFKDLFKKINIFHKYYFTRTSFSFHEEEVKSIFLKILDNGDIYEGFYQGNYCVSCEEYVSLADKCGFCFSNLVKVNEKCFFLKVEKYRKKIIDLYRTQKISVLPESSLNELFESFLNKEMPDLSITRRKLNWGIKVPGNPDLTFYVWFDALCSYATSLDGKRFFSEESLYDVNGESEIVQIIGKDIARFHFVYWPIILLSLKRKLPSKIISHGWILQSGFKMSKSKGNVINPIFLIDKYGSDSLRSFFCSKINFLSDGSLSNESLSFFHNDFFVNKLGNLFSRTRSMLKKYSCSKVPFKSSPFYRCKDNLFNLRSYSYISLVEKEVESYKKNMRSFQITKAFQNIENIVIESNKTISHFSPWKIFSSDYELFSELMVCLVNSIKIVSFLIMPFAPECGETIISEIGLDISSINFLNLLSFSVLNKVSFEKSEKNLFKKI